MGLPEMNLQNVHLENAVLRGTNGVSIIDADGIKMRNVKVTADEGPAFMIYNGKNIDAEEMEFKVSGNTAFGVFGELTDNINIQQNSLPDVKKKVKVGAEVDADEVKIK
jgi:hypothetical protein